MGNNGFLKVRRGLLEHFDADKINYFEAGLYTRLMLKADYSTGVAFTTTNELVSKDCSYFQVYRALQRLEKKGYIRSWRRNGEQKKYAVLINKFPREDGLVLNAFESLSWEDLKWEPAKVVQRSCKGDAKVVQRSDVQDEENKEVTLPKEVRSKELEKEEEYTDMSFKQNLSNKFLDHLGKKVFDNDPAWDELHSFQRVHGSWAVYDAFEQWLVSLDGEKPQYPSTAFVKYAGLILTAAVEQVKSNKPLIRELAYLSDNRVTFNNKHAMAIAKLTEEFTEDEIKSALKEFLDGLDEYSIKFAARDFSEKADQLIYTQRKRAELNKKIATQMAEMEAIPVVVPDEEPFEDIKL